MAGGAKSEKGTELLGGRSASASLATVVVTTFVTRLAGKALRQQIDEAPGRKDRTAMTEPAWPPIRRSPSSRWTSSTASSSTNVHPPDWVNPEPAAALSPGGDRRRHRRPGLGRGRGRAWAPGSP